MQLSMKPYTEYGSLAWLSAPKTFLAKTDRNIKKSIRTIMFKKKTWLCQTLLQIPKYKPFGISNEDNTRKIHVETYKWWTAKANKRQILHQNLYIKLPIEDKQWLQMATNNLPID